MIGSSSIHDDSQLKSLPCQELYNYPYTPKSESEGALPFLCSGLKWGHNCYPGTSEQLRCSRLYLLTCKKSKRDAEGGRTTVFLASLSKRMAPMPKKNRCVHHTCLKCTGSCGVTAWPHDSMITEGLPLPTLALMK